MGHTIAEKILGRAAGLGRPARAGEELQAKPDFVLAYDFPGYLDLWFRQMREEFGVARVREPERYAFFIDHFVPGAAGIQEETHKITRDWCRENGVALYDRVGIGHQVAVERGYAAPGSFSIHFDGHTSQLGVYGAYSIGVHKQVLEALVRETITLKVPHTTRVDFDGALAPGVMARDVFHHMVHAFGPAFCRFQALELGGEGYEALSLDERQSIACQAMFVGALTAIANPDRRVLDYMQSRARRTFEPVASDADAPYRARLRLDLSTVEPVVVKPPSPAATRALAECRDLAVQVGYIGSCSSGRLDDLRAAAHILRGRRIAEGFRLNIVPTSLAVLAQAAAEGLIATLVDAGAFIASSSCDLCFGHTATVAAGERCVSSGTLNTPGRMGSTDSEIYLCSAATVAATALRGAIADPRDVWP
jgi:3-isopropylmalate/(R)-2-methylmalate dehydratase large subunit